VQHASCMGMAAGTTALGPATYRSPKVRLLAVDPFTHVEGYLEPPRTLSTRNCTRSQVMFTIPPNVMHLLSTGMHMLQLRCVCMQDPAPAQRWPPNVQLALNMKAMPAMQVPASPAAAAAAAPAAVAAVAASRCSPRLYLPSRSKHAGRHPLACTCRKCATGLRSSLAAPAWARTAS
ncbi:hypothetical protein, partial [Brevundimonas sp.]|uniref:hypothetical protein n=1 Tax=Brevundimonas sp. TaxID=1871086 RepID=UPI0039199AB5